MDEKKIERIKDFLEKQGQSIDTIPNSKREQLDIVDESIQNNLESIENALEIIKDSKINITSISKKSGISRKTFYNNSLLKLYVEEYSTIDELNKISEVDYKRLKEKHDILNKQINNFLLRDVETETLRHEIDMLNLELKNLKNRNKALENQLENNLNELSDMKQKVHLNKGNVLDFPK